MTLVGLCGCGGQFESNLVGNPEDRFSRDEAHMSHVMRKCVFGDSLPGNIQTSLLES